MLKRMKFFRNRIKSLFFPALILWVIAGVIYLISPWYFGPNNLYTSIAFVFVTIGFSIILIEQYLLKKVTKKQLIGLEIVFVLSILIELSLIMLHYWVQ